MKDKNKKIQDEHPTKGPDVKAVLTDGRARVWLCPAWTAKTGPDNTRGLLIVTCYSKPDLILVYLPRLKDTKQHHSFSDHLESSRPR